LGEFTQGIRQAIELLVSGNNEIYEIMFLSLRVSLLAVFIGMLIGIPMGSFLGLINFRGKGLLINVLYTLMSLPPVIAGLIVYLMLSRSGPMGSHELLFTSTAMVIAQVLLVTPIITGLTMAAVAGKDRDIAETAVTLGATRAQTAWIIVREARGAILIGVITGLGRAISEVGAVMMVGGNILHETRVMTTAIVLQSRQGNFSEALALGIVLLGISFVINGVVSVVAGGRDSFNGNRHIYR
jgi:tungstate transport system permease protein